MPDSKRADLFDLFKNALREKSAALEFITTEDGLCIFYDGEIFLVSIEPTKITLDESFETERHP